MRANINRQECLVHTLKIYSLEAQNGDMRANINRQECLVHTLKIYSTGGNFDKMSQLISLAASGQDEDLDKELDECIRRIRTARMVQ